MRIRGYQADDRDELTRLYRLMFDDLDDAAAEVARVAALLPEGAALFVVEREAARLGGFVEAGWRSYAEGCDSSPVPCVEAWYVEPDLRRQAWGRALLAAVETWARAHGAVELASDARLDNTAAQAAHRRLGFSEVERVVCFRKPL